MSFANPSSIRAPLGLDSHTPASTAVPRASFRTYIPESDAWYVVWVMANVEGYSVLRAEVIDREVRTTGQGRDPGGALIERGRYHDIFADGYSFTLDRSYDGGKTWIRPFVSYRATRRAASK